jgi:hypothetical protein
MLRLRNAVRHWLSSRKLAVHNDLTETDPGRKSLDDPEASASFAGNGSSWSAYDHSHFHPLLSNQAGDSDTRHA